MKKIAIMQPYFFPYLGYWQLINAVDEFIVYDNIQYTKKGWINRNRFLLEGKDLFFTIPLKKSSDYLDIIEKDISSDFDKEKFLNRVKHAYYKAPNFNEIFDLISKCIYNEQTNLFYFIYLSIISISKTLGIKTRILISSQLDVDHELIGKDKVLEICKRQKAGIYINPVGGIDLYDKQEFANNGIELKFLKAQLSEYKQFNNEFIPALSILDVLMFNTPREMQQMLKDYELL